MFLAVGHRLRGTYRFGRFGFGHRSFGQRHHIFAIAGHYVSGAVDMIVARKFSSGHHTRGRLQIGPLHGVERHRRRGQCTRTRTAAARSQAGEDIHGAHRVVHHQIFIVILLFHTMQIGVSTRTTSAGPAIGEAHGHHHGSSMYIVFDLRIFFFRAQVVEQGRTHVERPRAVGIEVPTEVQSQFRHQITRSQIAIGRFFLEVVSPTERQNTVEFNATRFNRRRDKQVYEIDSAINIDLTSGTATQQEVLIGQQQVAFHTQRERRRELAFEIESKHPRNQ